MVGFFDRFKAPKIEIKKTTDQEIEEVLLKLDDRQVFRIELVADRLNQLAESNPACVEIIASKLKERAKIELQECSANLGDQNKSEEIGYRLQYLFNSLDTLISNDDGADDVDSAIKKHIQNDIEFKKLIVDSLPDGMEGNLRIKFENLLS